MMQPRPPQQTRPLFKAATGRPLFRLLVLCLLGLGVVSAGSVEAGVVVRLRDGRRAAGDALRLATDSRFVLLRRRSGHAVLTRRLAIEEIDSVRFDGRSHTRRSLLKRLGGRRLGGKRLDAGEGTATTRQPIVPVHFRSQSLLSAERLSSTARLQKVPGALLVQKAPSSRVFHRADCCREPFIPILGLEGVVIGVQDDPLSAYRDDVKRFFPHGVPLSETGFAREMLRERRARQIIESDFPNVPPGSVSSPAMRRFRKGFPHLPATSRPNGGLLPIQP